MENEEAIFVATGQTKKPKVYGVLFVDADNALQSQLAEAVARKGWAELGRYSSAGWDVADALSPELAPTAASLGLDVGLARPDALQMLQDPPDGPHVVVALNALDRPLGIPFHTCLQRWEVSTDDLSGTVRELGERIGELMEILRGDT